MWKKIFYLHSLSFILIILPVQKHIHTNSVIKQPIIHEPIFYGGKFAEKGLAKGAALDLLAHAKTGGLIGHGGFGHGGVGGLGHLGLGGLHGGIGGIGGFI